MRSIPSIPPTPSVVTDALDVKPINYLRAPPPVGERNLTPLVFPHRQTAEKAGSGAAGNVPPLVERRRKNERRKYSRRIRPAGSTLYDTRAHEERRSGNRRDSDITTKIQEKA
ncbi:MAG: hypothetical protein Q8N54_10845 [Sulfurimicrobium sp.]|jgi:hypothetical protein|nr:hypothetical protein [Sulfurimicrobium sp.]MDO9190865.1 hypothetical protein [Sulfurimicrobium sp.]MDP1703118.1 hypothetical protein [Sulfurimicrobium sp.]MDP2197165.1 hypothetical protein [Sulfurimicrobium sp.]MDP2963244.1 hypothetical protein [Sulfurimicrobium sp.]